MTIKTLAKNTAVLSISTIFSLIMGLFTVLYTARYLGSEGFGILSLALSITAIFGVFLDIGLSSLTTREVSRNKPLASKYIENIAVIKILLSVLTFGIIILAVNLIGYPSNVINIIYLITISVIFGSFTGMFNSIFQAFEKMEYISIGTIMNATIMLIGTLIFIYYKLDIYALASLYLLSNGIVLIFAFTIFSWKFFFPKVGIDLTFWKPTLKEAISFGLSGIFIVIYFYIDSVLLSIMVSESAVGIYSAAYRLVFVLLFIPNVFIMSIFPIMSQHFKSSKELLELEYEKSFKYLFAIAIFIFIYGFTFADKIILIIYGTGFNQSILTLQILIFVIPIIFITSLFGTVFGAINKQRFVVIVTGVNALINISLNIILIPKFSYLGASIATVLTEGLGFILLFTYLSKNFLNISIKSNILKTILSGIVTSLLIYYLKISINWIVAAILGVFVYILILYILKIITNEDIEIFKKIFV